MSFTEYLIEPTNLEHPETIIMYPFPVLADIQNTGDRLQATADIAGISIIASDLYSQKKKTIFDMSARAANQPSADVYRDMSYFRNDFFNDRADTLGAKIRIGFGDSLGVSAIQGMQIHATSEHPTFDALLLRDGWDLQPGTTAIGGLFRYAQYQIRDVIHQKKDAIQFDIPETEFQHAPKEHDETSTLAKLRNVSDVMRGTHNRDIAIKLAGETAVVMNVVTLTDGLSASNTSYLRSFQKELTDARRDQHPLKHLEGLMAKQYPGWHSDLLDPKRAARDLHATIDILSNPRTARF